MKKFLFLIICSFITTANVFADTERYINKNIAIETGKQLELDGFNGFKVDFVKWEKNEIGFKLKVVVDCSDSDYEKEYADSIDIVNRLDDSKQIIFFIKKRLEAKKHSFLGLFSFRLFYHFSSKIEGEIYIPSTFSGRLNISYSDIYFSGMEKLPEIIGRSNDLIINNCSAIPKIDNPYGNIKLDNTSGNVTIKTRSNKVEISGHRGNLEIDAEYSNIKLSDVDGGISINDRSASIEVVNCGLKKIYAPYSDIKLRNILKTQNEELQINGNSMTCNFDHIEPDLRLAADYSKITFTNLKGALVLNGHSNTLKGSKLLGNLYMEGHYTRAEIDDINSRETKITNSNDYIYLYFNSDPVLIEIKNTYGNVKVKLPRTYKGEITANTSYGKIESDFNTKVKKQNDSQTTVFQPAESSPGKISISVRNGDIYFINK